MSVADQPRPETSADHHSTFPWQPMTQPPTRPVPVLIRAPWAGRLIAVIRSFSGCAFIGVAGPREGKSANFPTPKQSQL
jgi:hypothetical protein